MKKLLMLVVTLMLGASLAVAQPQDKPNPDKPAATKTAKKAPKNSKAKPKAKDTKAKKTDSTASPSK